MKVGRGTDKIRDHRASGDPVLENPLSVKISLRPRNNGLVAPLGDGRDIIDEIGNVLRIDLSVVQHGTRNIEVDQVEAAIIIEQFAQIGNEVDATKGSSARYEENRPLLTIGECRWNVNCCS